MLSATSRPAARLLHDLPEVWCADQLAQAELPVVASGHPALDAHLPAGGWPLGALVEVLQSFAEQHAWQLLLPALVQALRTQAGPVVLVGAPREPFGPALRAQGLSPERLLWVRADLPAQRLWAAEQALRCAEVAAVLAWLPQARSAELRRLHMAAQQQGRLLFVLRPLRACNEATPAVLRLKVQGVDALQVTLLKRRGPPLTTPITLSAHPPRLAALLALRQGAVAKPPSVQPRAAVRSPALRAVALHPGSHHVLDRTAAF